MAVVQHQHGGNRKQQGEGLEGPLREHGQAGDAFRGQQRQAPSGSYPGGDPAGAVGNILSMWGRLLSRWEKRIPWSPPERRIQGASGCICPQNRGFRGARQTCFFHNVDKPALPQLRIWPVWSQGFYGCGIDKSMRRSPLISTDRTEEEIKSLG